MTIRLLCGDALEQLRLLEENSIDAVVTDPPYGLRFMGRDWDHGIPGEPFWREGLRVAKPGAHLLAFGGTRTFHRLACAIEDAGWEIRDCLMWVYGSGFPKSLDVSKAIDKAAGAKRDAVGVRRAGIGRHGRSDFDVFHASASESEKRVFVTAPASAAARQWQGWGTGLKPAWEPIILARKPLEGTVAENVQKWGTGALNIDGCRVAASDFEPRDRVGAAKLMEDRPWQERQQEEGRPRITEGNSLGRWPANLIHDGSDEVVGMFPAERPGMASQKPHDSGELSCFGLGRNHGRGFDDSGSAARFFYCAKASKADRDEGLGGIAQKVLIGAAGHKINPMTGREVVDIPRHNIHPTVKPTDLMRYLCRLVTPPGGTVLDPFMGSGSTGKAALLEGFGFIGIDNVPEYVEMARRRIEGTAPLFARAAGEER